MAYTAYSIILDSIDRRADSPESSARRWQAMVEAFTGGDPDITELLRRLYAEDRAAVEKLGGPDAEMRDFMARAAAAGGGDA